MKIPKRNFKKYIEIAEKGCGIEKINANNGCEYECNYGYSWSCDRCPCTIEHNKKIGYSLAFKTCENISSKDSKL